MRLVLDAGNSSTKYGVFENHQLLFSGKLDKSSSILSVLDKETLNKIECIASCHVTENLNITNLPNVPHIQINTESTFPFGIQYKTKETLGVDRVIACSSIHQINKNLLVIDCGTCVTYDFVSAEKGYVGGGISPGIHLRFKAMNNFTDQLPLITQFERKNELIGTSTSSSLKSGVINGLMAEIKGIIQQYEQRYENLIVFLTGGDSIYFEDGLKSSIFADQNLVLKGLDFLIDLNEK